MATFSTVIANGIGNDIDLGIGVNPPTNPLHVSSSSNPVRFEGVGVATDTKFLTIDSDGVVHYKFSGANGTSGSVSYTHLTLPTNREV